MLYLWYKFFITFLSEGWQPTLNKWTRSLDLAAQFRMKENALRGTFMSLRSCISLICTCSSQQNCSTRPSGFDRNKKVPCTNATHFHQVALLLCLTPNCRHQCLMLVFGHQMQEILHRHCCFENHLTVPSFWQEPFFQRRMNNTDWIRKKLNVNCLLLDNSSGQ